MEVAVSEFASQAAIFPRPSFTIFPATILAAVITQVCISIRERNERVRRQKATLAAIQNEFEVISTSLNKFWIKVQNAWNESDRHAIIEFCTSPYPEGSLAAWISSVRVLLPMLSTDQIRQKIEWLYAIDALGTLRKKLVDNYEFFCLFEQSRSLMDGEELREMSDVQRQWIMSQVPRLIEFKNIIERIQLMHNRLLSRQCNTI